MSDEITPADEMMSKMQDWGPATGVSRTVEGLEVDTGNYKHTAITHRIYEENGWVIDRVHWDTNSFHIVPKEVFDE